MPSKRGMKLLALAQHTSIRPLASGSDNQSLFSLNIFDPLYLLANSHSFTGRQGP